ncbi:MAG: hypothetical protein M3083_14580 [Actinomycetota bacterium]|nr:hypothetical protein [Actinomycetota bacterium]MDQ6944914.1 hypothetical protein [Actinomycetota bacterium]
MAAHDAGVQVTCPGCGQTVLQKAMIPVLVDEGPLHHYLCVPCARALIALPPVHGDVPGDVPGDNGPAVSPAGRDPGPGVEATS